MVTVKSPVMTLASFVAFFMTLATAAQAALITNQWTFTFQTASGLYNPGDIITITATYDDVGSMMHNYNDGGPAGQSNHGAPPDTIDSTYCLGTGAGCDVSNYSFYGYTLMSDATISISGL
jgi:hypothetical protein